MLSFSHIALQRAIGLCQILCSPSELTDENTLRLAFDSSWTLCTAEDNAGFYAELKSTPAEETGIMKGEITVYDVSTPESPIYTLSVMHHTAERRGSHE